MPKPKTLTPAQVKALIKRRNKRFRKANKAGKRVLIAQDVIDSIKAKLFEPASGIFLRSPHLSGSYSHCADDGTEVYHKKPGGDLRDVILSRQVTDCSACALGGLMLSCTLFNDKLPANRAVAYMGGS